MKRILIATLTGLALSAHAVPVRLDYSGSVRFLVDMSTGLSVPSAIGNSFSGFLIYDVANPEIYEAGVSEYGQPRAMAHSDSGCGQLTNGVCVLNRGSNEPVVIDYAFSYMGNVFGPLPADLGFSDGSSRSNQSAGGSPSGEHWSAERNQFQYVLTGDPFADYILTLSQRVVQVSAFAFGDGLLDQPADNLTQGFNLAAASPAHSEVRFFDYRSLPLECTYPDDCDFQFAAGSFDLNGTLESVQFRVVPEPSTPALLGLGLAAVALLRRRPSLNLG